MHLPGAVLPLGGANITRDFQAEHISQADAETLKIHAGYKADNFIESSISAELRDNIIGARMMEILQNVNRQIKNSGESINSVVVTGGGAKLKNIETLLADNLPGLRVRIATDTFVDFNVGSNIQLKRGEPSVTLLGLLKKGKENCTQGPKPQEQLVMKDMFIEEHVEEKPKVEEQQTKVVEEEVKKEEQPNKENKEKDKPTKKHKQTDNGPSIWGSWFKPFDSLSEKMKKATKEFIDNTTQEEDDSDDEHNAL